MRRSGGGEGWSADGVGGYDSGSLVERAALMAWESAMGSEGSMRVRLVGGVSQPQF